ncbi:LPXTG cell wall anchor domain-containing protein, partial [Bacillus mycoides]
ETKVDDKKEVKNVASGNKETYKELPKTGEAENNSALLGGLMAIAGAALAFGRKFKKTTK